MVIIFLLFFSLMSFLSFRQIPRFSAVRCTVTGEGITAVRFGKTYQLRWEDCADIGAILAYVPRIGRYAQPETLRMVYATTLPLMPEEYWSFVKSRRNRPQDTIFFECSDQMLQEFLSVLPEHFHDRFHRRTQINAIMQRRTI